MTTPEEPISVSVPIPVPAPSSTADAAPEPALPTSAIAAVEPADGGDRSEAAIDADYLHDAKPLVERLAATDVDFWQRFNTTACKLEASIPEASGGAADVNGDDTLLAPKPLNDALVLKLQHHQDLMRRGATTTSVKVPAADASAAVAAVDDHAAASTGIDFEEDTALTHGTGAATAAAAVEGSESGFDAEFLRFGSGRMRMGVGMLGAAAPSGDAGGDAAIVHDAVAAAWQMARPEEVRNYNGGTIALGDADAGDLHPYAMARVSGWVMVRGQKGGTSKHPHSAQLAGPVQFYAPLWAAHRFRPSVVPASAPAAASPTTDMTVGSFKSPRTPIRELWGSAPFPSEAAAGPSGPLAGVGPANKKGGKPAPPPPVPHHFYATHDALALHQEVCDLVDWLRPTEAEMAMRRLAELEVSDIVRGLWPEAQVVAYGSIMTQLMLPTSDVDMTVTNLPASVSTEEALIAIHRRMQDTRMASIASSVPQLLLKTRVPLLKFEHARSHIDLDISVNAVDGLANSRSVSELLDSFPESRYLIPLVKYFLQQRDANEPYKGGLGSFATSLLVLSFLQHHPIYTTRTQDRPRFGLGRLLLDFFRYHSSLGGLNPQRVAIALTKDRGYYFPRSQSYITQTVGPTGQEVQMLLEDPGTPTNNGASSLRNWHQVSSAFDGAYVALTAAAPHHHGLQNPGNTAELSRCALGLHRIVVPPLARADVAPDARRFVFDTLEQAQRTLNRMQPITDVSVMRPTLLSRIFHPDVAMVARRRQVQDSFDRLVASRAEADVALLQRVRAAMAADADMFLRVVDERMDQRAASFGEVAGTSARGPAPMFRGGVGAREAREHALLHASLEADIAAVAADVAVAPPPPTPPPMASPAPVPLAMAGQRRQRDGDGVPAPPRPPPPQQHQQQRQQQQQQHQRSNARRRQASSDDDDAGASNVAPWQRTIQ
jgi:hypothetical protein